MPDWEHDNLFQQICSMNRAAEARKNGDETQAQIHDVNAREYARQEKLRLARLRTTAEEPGDKASELKKP